MQTEIGICCRCGDEIGPPFDRLTDWLCKHCYDATHKPPRLRANPRKGNERLLTPYKRDKSLEWQEKIDEKIDEEIKQQD